MGSRVAAHSACMLVLGVALSAPVRGAEPAPHGDAAKGKVTATTVCAACHGPDGNSVVPVNPSLASQHAQYIEKQLHNFKANTERKNPIMQGMAATLNDEAMRDVGAYYASQKAALNVARNDEQAKLGQRIYRAGLADAGVPACAGCHGPDGSGIPAQFPRLAAQHKDYTVAQLKGFRSGERANDANQMMRMVAARLSDAQIDALAEYIAGLR